MSDEKAFQEEDEIPDLAELEEIPDLPDPPEGGAPDLPSEASPASGSASGAPPGASGERPPLRELDQAPEHLRKAALIVAAGSLVPWMGHGGGLVTAVGAKAVALLGVWLWLQQVKHNWGPSLGGTLGKLGDLSLKPKKKEEEKPARRARASKQAAKQPATGVSHPFPTGLHLLSLVSILVACIAMPLLDPQPGANPGIAMAEVGMLAWAAFTWVHIYAYERWGHFNPIFPLMFLGMVVGGAAQVIAGFGGIPELSAIASVAGGGVVAAGGVFAAYTIVEALRQAKREGDRKKQEAIEARKAARQARRPGRSS